MFTKGKIHNILIIIIILIGMFCISVPVSGLSVQEYTVRDMIESIIPTEAYSYANNRLIPFATTIQEYPDDFENKIVNSGDLTLGKPYIVFNASNDGKQDSTYQFPVVENEIIKFILSVSYTDNSYSASISEGLANKLNNIDYCNDDSFLFYSDSNCIYADNGKSVTALEEIEVSNTNSSTINAEIKFKNLSYTDKIHYIGNKYNYNFDNVSENEISAYDNTQGFSEKSTYVVTLNTNNCLTPQYNDGNCWAASVATTLKYLDYSKFKNLTARNVCDKINVGYNEGGTLVTRRNALVAYGIIYYNKYLTYPMEFGVIKNNILNQRPILMSCYGLSSGSGHAITVIGYTTYGGINQVRMHNSGTNSVFLSEHKTNGLTFSYNNESYKWRGSLSVY